ncbi:hypothetical protein SRHO_G00305490, partial [Serrasalmus rhombeus]
MLRLQTTMPPADPSLSRPQPRSSLEWTTSTTTSPSLR